MHCVRRAASRAICTAGNSSATSTPMMAITTSSSTSVKALRIDGRLYLIGWLAFRERTLGKCLLFYLGRHLSRVGMQLLPQLRSLCREDANGKQAGVFCPGFADRQRGDGNTARHLHHREQRIKPA